MKPPILLMLALVAIAVLVHPYALERMQLSAIEEWSTPYGYVNLYRLLRLVGPLALGVWGMWRLRRDPQRSRLVLLLTCVAGVLGLVSLQS